MKDSLLFIVGIILWFISLPFVLLLIALLYVNNLFWALLSRVAGWLYNHVLSRDKPLTITVTACKLPVNPPCYEPDVEDNYSCLNAGNNFIKRLDCSTCIHCPYWARET